MPGAVQPLTYGISKNHGSGVDPDRWAVHKGHGGCSAVSARSQVQLRKLKFISERCRNPSVNTRGVRGRRRSLCRAQLRVKALDDRLAPAEPPGPGAEELTAAQKRRHRIIPPLFPGLPRFPRTMSRIVQG